MKCIWCGKKLTEENKDKLVCYELDYNKFYFCSEKELAIFLILLDKVQKNKSKFLILVFLSMLGSIASEIIYGAININLIPWGSGAWGGLLLGWTLIKYPYATPQTNSILGIKTSMKIVKRMGYILLFLGILCFYFFLVQIF